jgi:hypothetical protein
MAEFFNDRMSYRIIRGHWCDIIVHNTHAPTENSDGKKNNFCEELRRVLDQVTKYYMEILLGDFNGKQGEKIILN